MNGYQRRKQQKRESIQRAALELFSVHGIKRVSIAEIAKMAGVNPVTIYNHFQDKNGLVRDVINELITSQWGKYREILENEQPFLRKLEQIITSKMEAANLYGNELLRTALSEYSDIREMVETLFESEINPLVTRFIREGQENGSINHELSVDTIAVYLDMFTSLARNHPELFSEKKRMTEFTREIWSLFLYGLIGTEAGA